MSSALTELVPVSGLLLNLTAVLEKLSAWISTSFSLLEV
jgi:hypothetical protein